MTQGTAAQIRQWSEELARNPASLVFLPLATAHRAEGRHDVALRLCIRGLERYPDHVDTHVLLGHLYRSAGDAVKAFDEWDIALRLDGEHREARREIGLVALDLGHTDLARRHLQRAGGDDPADARVAEALAGMPSAADKESTAAPRQPQEAETVGGYMALERQLRAAGAEAGVLGAVILDSQGYVLAGEMRADGRDRAAELAAALRGASDDADRAVRHLELGEWQAILLETEHSRVRLMPLPDAMIAVAAARSVPAGWLNRLGGRLHSLAQRFLSGANGEAFGHGE